MAFSKSLIESVRLDDPVSILTKKQKSYLEKSWAGYFAKKIFPLIDENKFSVLYSDKHIGRFNNPVNQLLGIIIIKDLFRYSDSVLFNESVLDLRIKYALCCSDKIGVPCSLSSLSKFRSKVSQYKRKTGQDLIFEQYELMKEPLIEMISLYKLKPLSSTKLYKVIHK